MLPREIIFKIPINEVKVFLVAVNSRKEVRPALRKSLQRRLRDWAAVVLHSRHSQEYEKHGF